MPHPPGVYIGEIPSAPPPIAAAPTAMAAFIGEGAPQQRVLTSSLELRLSWTGDSELARAVGSFFDNGGARAWVASVPSLTPESVTTAIASMDPGATVLATFAETVMPPEVLSATAAALKNRGVLLLVEGPWADAASALTPGAIESIGVGGPDVALYWPRLRREDGTDISPLGAVAGVIARTDTTRGVFVSPAGTGSELRSIKEPAVAVSSAELNDLAALSINVIRHFGGRGTLVWGGRTLAPGSEWRYLAVRRTTMFIERSIRDALTWVAFETNDEQLWRRVRESVDTFLLALWRAGALVGSTPRDAFFVRCDASTTTQVDIDRGEVVIQMGFALLRPADFALRMVRVSAATG
jgi:phage tail sheath protein FI